MDSGFADAEALGGGTHRRLVLNDVKGQPTGPLLDVPFHTRNTPHRGFHCGMYMRAFRGTERDYTPSRGARRAAMAGASMDVPVKCSRAKMAW